MVQKILTVENVRLKKLEYFKFIFLSRIGVAPPPPSSGPEIEGLCTASSQKVKKSLFWESMSSKSKMEKNRAYFCTVLEQIFPKRVIGIGRNGGK